MKRKWYIAIGISAISATCLSAWWFFVRQPDRPPWWTFPRKQDRLPTLFGIVERIHPEAGTTAETNANFRYRLRATKPNRPDWESSQNAYHRQAERIVDFWVLQRASVKNRAGESCTIQVGDTISAWCTGPTAMSHPPIWTADKVIVEPPDW